MKTRYWGYSREQGWVVRDRNQLGTDCPHCESRAFRIPRRFRDRLISLVVPMRRYRCLSSECGWEGNLPAPRAAKQGGLSPIWQYMGRAHAPTVVPRD